VALWHQHGEKEGRKKKKARKKKPAPKPDVNQIAARIVDQLRVEPNLA
jgi:hypothetical protein